jgi:hypothetical protein
MLEFHQHLLFRFNHRAQAPAAEEGTGTEIDTALPQQTPQ